MVFFEYRAGPACRRRDSQRRSGSPHRGPTRGAQSRAGTSPLHFCPLRANIGLLQPVLAEELREAAATYPETWIEEAFRIAAEHNVRNWRYIRTILERWAREGRGHETHSGRAPTHRAAETRRRFLEELD
ncbi:MAG: DnaD domain protein [Ardenticatenia bacterium]|nr:DnaD domain protein [Ardenticatenia bacterium]